MSAPFIRIPHTPGSGRVRDFLNEISRVAADPGLGASLDQIEKSYRSALAAGPSNVVDEKDLVTKLINDNPTLWGQLLRNRFSMAMKAAGPSDQKVLKGFMWYMRQDFSYIIKNCNYEADCGTKATNQKDFETSMNRVAARADYAKELLGTCITPQPKGLGLEDSVVLSTKQSNALKRYLDFFANAAKTQNWAVALVAMIPCIQSYYLIAGDLVDNSAHKDTLWYNLWAMPNSQYKGSTEMQKIFFKENYDQWKDHYATANDIFKRACQAEIDLWETGLHPET